MTFSSLLYVIAGGASGCCVRYLISMWLAPYAIASIAVYGTLCVNTLGCLLIGAANGLAQTRMQWGSEWRLLLIVGFLGGLTTFSGVAYDIFALLRAQHALLAVSYAIGHMTLGVLAVGIGYYCALHYC